MCKNYKCQVLGNYFTELLTKLYLKDCVAKNQKEITKGARSCENNSHNLAPFIPMPLSSLN